MLILKIWGLNLICRYFPTIYTPTAEWDRLDRKAQFQAQSADEGGQMCETDYCSKQAMAFLNKFSLEILVALNGKTEERLFILIELKRLVLKYRNDSSLRS